MNCKICNNLSQTVFVKTVLKKHEVRYYKCTRCNFIQTEKPYWLNEAYQSAITQLDIGLVSRNLYYAEIIEEWFLRGFLNADGKFLDFAGGYGLFVRLMRDRGFDYYRQDLFCENIFAEHFDLNNLPQNQYFEAITAFEVFEHLEDPIDELRKMISYSDIIIFSTELQPSTDQEIGSWWYLTPETGQHISLYSYASLEELAKLEKLYLYSNKRNLHILSKHKLSLNPFKKPKSNLIAMLNKKLGFAKNIKLKRESLLDKDFHYIKNNM